MLGNTHVVRVVVIDTPPTQDLTELDRQKREFISLLEASDLNGRAADNLFALFKVLQERLTSEDLVELLSQPSRVDQGFVRLPAGTKLRESRFLDCDSEDPATFLPVRDCREADVDELEEAVERNAAGLGVRVTPRQSLRF